VFAAAVLPMMLMVVDDAATDRCLERQGSRNGIALMIYRGDRLCYDFEPSVIVSGLWVDEFEGQRFLPGARTLVDAERMLRDRRARHIWFTTDEKTRWEGPRPDGARGGGQIYRVRVEGRYARKADLAAPGGFGHLGASDGLFLADRIISLDPLGKIAR
jgi:hypothetical protein